MNFENFDQVASYIAALEKKVTGLESELSRTRDSYGALKGFVENNLSGKLNSELEQMSGQIKALKESYQPTIEQFQAKFGELESALTSVGQQVVAQKKETALSAMIKTQYPELIDLWEDGHLSDLTNLPDDQMATALAARSATIKKILGKQASDVNAGAIPPQSQNPQTGSPSAPRTIPQIQDDMNRAEYGSEKYKALYEEYMQALDSEPVARVRS